MGGGLICAFRRTAKDFRIVRGCLFRGIFVYGDFYDACVGSDIFYDPLIERVDENYTNKVLGF